METIFITGGTGYIGSRLIAELQNRGCQIYALVRSGSESKLPTNCAVVYGNALDAESYQASVPQGCTFIHLVGTPHPGPTKKEQFVAVDLCSIHEAVKAARMAQVKHFVYLSVAQHPSGIMQAYQNVRAEGEKIIAFSAFNATFVRPWYVVGPGHYWALLLRPLYMILKMIPVTREKARAFDLVTIRQMVLSLTQAVMSPPLGTHIISVTDIQQM